MDKINEKEKHSFIPSLTSIDLKVLLPLYLIIFLFSFSGCDDTNKMHDLENGIREDGINRDVKIVKIEIYFSYFSALGDIAMNEEMLVSGPDYKIIKFTPAGENVLLGTIGKLNPREEHKNYLDARLACFLYSSEGEITKLFFDYVTPTVSINGKQYTATKELVLEIIKYLPVEIYPEAQYFLSSQYGIDLPELSDYPAYSPPF